jgi:hypothetical protein
MATISSLFHFGDDDDDDDENGAAAARRRTPHPNSIRTLIFSRSAFSSYHINQQQVVRFANAFAEERNLLLPIAALVSLSKAAP